jgi:diadenosine tetraphosphate (Ap4A) HIT family hydrolase
MAIALMINFNKKEHTMPTLIHQRVLEAHRGENPTAICRMPSGWAVIGDQQFIPGYCLLLADPVVPDLNALTGSQRTQFMVDMALIGDALLQATEAYRINYEILGNTEPALHAHILPRYLTEPEDARKVPVWMGYSHDVFYSRPFERQRDLELMDNIARFIQMKLNESR